MSSFDRHMRVPTAIMFLAPVVAAVLAAVLLVVLGGGETQSRAGDAGVAASSGQEGEGIARGEEARTFGDGGTVLDDVEVGDGGSVPVSRTTNTAIAEEALRSHAPHDLALLAAVEHTRVGDEDLEEVLRGLFWLRDEGATRSSLEAYIERYLARPPRLATAARTWLAAELGEAPTKGGTDEPASGSGSAIKRFKISR